MLFNAMFPAKNVPSVAETRTELFSQQLYSNEQPWEGMAARIYHLRAPEEPVHIQTDCDAVILHLRGIVHLQRRADAHLVRGISGPGSVCIDPKNQPKSYFWQQASGTMLYLYLAPFLIEQVIAEMGRNDPRHVEIVSQFNIHDPLIEQIGLCLVEELQSRGLAGRIYAESLARTLALHVLRLSSTASLVPEPPQQNLTRHQLSVVRDTIHDRLDQDISLQDLSNSIGMSVSRFCRLFKQSTGLTPHQYVIACRVERARVLLLNKERTIAQVAQAVGFADQSHLSRHCKQLLGVPPGALRKESKNLQK